MSHGGSRKGAGRPPKLTWEQRIWIAATYKALMREEAVRRHKEANPGFAELIELNDQLQAVPLKARRMRLRNSTKLGDGDAPMDELIGDIGDVICNRFGGSRFVSSSSVRPYGVRAELFVRVAQEATKRFGVNVSERLVKACVEDYAAWLSEDRHDET